MSLTKEMWKDPEFRKKMKDAQVYARFHPKEKEFEEDFEGYSEKGTQNRPYYIPLPDNWQQIKHINPESIEKNLSGFLEIIKPWLEYEQPKKKERKPFTDEVEKLIAEAKEMGTLEE